MQPIFLIAGAPAAGKSSAARALAARLPRSLHVHVDALRTMVISGAQHPAQEWSAGLAEQLRLARETAVEMALRYRAAGFAVAIDDFWDPHSELREYAALSAQPLFRKILLAPTRQAALERNLRRATSAEEAYYIGMGIASVYDDLEQRGDQLAAAGWEPIDTTELSIEAVAEAILAPPAR